jgi:hypothetical protein
VTASSIRDIVDLTAREAAYAFMTKSTTRLMTLLIVNSWDHSSNAARLRSMTFRGLPPESSIRVWSSVLYRARHAAG